MFLSNNTSTHQEGLGISSILAISAAQELSLPTFQRNCVRDKVILLIHGCACIHSQHSWVQPIAFYIEVQNLLQLVYAVELDSWFAEFYENEVLIQIKPPIPSEIP